ncbi:MAG: hypothetical protein NT067_01295 [Candidatus Diapherotrites archaeon]|nr:hypothetical protein [Candidatus Diapherotrites archaeon]
MAEFRVVDFSSLSEAQRAEATRLTMPKRVSERPNLKFGAWTLMKEYGVLLVMLNGEKPVGVLAGWIGLKGRRKCLNIAQLFTKPSHAYTRESGKTVAEALVESAVKDAKGKGTAVFGFLRGKEVEFIGPREANEYAYALAQRHVEKGAIKPVKRIIPGRPKHYRILRKP